MDRNMANGTAGTPFNAKKMPLTTQRSVGSYGNIRNRPSIVAP